MLSGEGGLPGEGLLSPHPHLTPTPKGKSCPGAFAFLWDKLLQNLSAVTCEAQSHNAVGLHNFPSRQPRFAIDSWLGSQPHSTGSPRLTTTTEPEISMATGDLGFGCGFAPFYDGR